MRVAESFARIFFRNAINIGLPVIECKEISAAVDNGDELVVDFDAGTITEPVKKEKPSSSEASTLYPRDTLGWGLN